MLITYSVLSSTCWNKFILIATVDVTWILNFDSPNTSADYRKLPMDLVLKYLLND